MTPKEKANELVEKFYLELRQHSFNYDEETSKQCALICVDEIQKTDALLNESDAQCIEGYEDTIRIEFWEEVKQEIILL